MTESTKGVRSLPAALTLGFAIGFVMMGMRIVFVHVQPETWRAVRFNLISEGTTVASLALCLLGALELARRMTGRAAQGIKLAALGFAGGLAADVSYTAIQLVDEFWKHQWISTTFAYSFFTAWLLVAIGLGVAHWEKRRDIAGAVVLVSLLAWPPPFLAKTLYGWLPAGKTAWTFEMVLLAFRLVVLLAAFAALERTAATSDPPLAARGLRTAAKALWLRVIAAVGLVLLTLLMIGGGGSRGSVDVLKLAMIVAAIINIVALAQVGFGAARAARAGVAGLGRWPLVVGGAATLWAAGVTLAQFPWLYKMLYKGDEGLFGRDARELAQALSVTMPLVVTAGIAAIAFAIGGLAVRRGNEELRGHVQGKGTGFVALTLVSVAIQSWMLPKAGSLGAFAMLSLLAASAGLVATVMMAKLLGLAADALESEPGLPSASVVSDGR